MDGILLDTNIIIYALNKLDPDCKKAKTFINKNLDVLVVADQNINEAVRILTHKKFKTSVDIKTAIKAVRKISDECTHITPNIYTRKMFFELVKKYKVTSNNIYDAYLTATAITNSVPQIATNNVSDFMIYDEIDIVKLSD